MKRHIPYILLPVLFIGMILLSSCESYNSEDVNQQKIETHYSLSYDADEQVTTAAAYFKFGSAYLEINEPALVSFEGNRLFEHKLLGIITYDNLYDGLLEAGEFFYLDQNGNEYHNFAQMIEPIELPSRLELSIADGGKVKWKGEPLKYGQKITMVITNNGEQFSKSTHAINATEFRIDPYELPDTLRGTAEIYLRRNESRELQEAPEEGGKLSAEYISEIREIYIRIR